MATNFPNGITSMGTFLPSGSGGVGIPPGGTHFWVKPYSGSDSNSGLNPSEALKTVKAAYALCTADKNDVVHLMAESNTASLTTDYLSDSGTGTIALDWAKDGCHLVGECPRVKMSQRARIAQLSTNTTSVYLLKVSADGCIFDNFQLFQGVNSATPTTCLWVTGTRNTFSNVHVAGIGDAGQIAGTARDLYMYSASENVFNDCVFGLDTVLRDASCSNVTFYGTPSAGCQRNYFNHCLFQAYTSVAGYHVQVGQYAIERWAIFDNCAFISDSTNRLVSPSMTAVFNHAAVDTKGQILLFNCRVSGIGTSDWSVGSDGACVRGDMIAPTAACAGGLMTVAAA